MSLGETIIYYNLGELFIVRSIPVWPVWVEYMFGVRAGVFFLFFFFFLHANRKTFYSLYVLSIIPNCDTNTVHVLLAVDLKVSSDICYE